VWTDRIRNRCSGRNPDKRVLIDISTQFARLCRGDVQVLTTPITSGASAYGNGTPTGTWRVQAKQRERYLYPAAGGAYYVHYWIPYDGDYGMHDSSWQHFPYGSRQYRTRGSHGCVHFPLTAIRWMYGWLRVGTLVRIQT
jgi:lipoprotein-anchoring transpeptidase ErfK/SrfK